jgi:hypothetical protein
LGHKPTVAASVELNLFWGCMRECLLHRSQTTLELSYLDEYVLVIPYYHYVIKSTAKQALIAVV